jgi:mannan endo-1,4-beta-mannosidase
VRDRRRYLRTRAALAVAAVLSVCGLSSAVAATPRGPVAWGVYLPDSPPGSLPAIRSLGASVGKQPGIVMWYPNWGGPYSAVTYARAGVDAVLATGAVPMLTWMTRDPSTADPVTTAAYSNVAIAAGSKDDYITSFARGLKTARGPVYLRLDHEMNGVWYPWSPGSGLSTSANYIAMWRHVHDIFVREGATNVRWVWSPNVRCGGCTPMADLYPGDAYVDWIALDGYNFGTSDGHQWQSFDQVYSASYTEILKITKKPLMIAEMGTVERGPRAGQTKAAWIADALGAIQRRYPAFRAFVWFEQNNGVGQDFRIRSTTTNVQAFRKALSPTVFVTGPPR